MDLSLIFDGKTSFSLKAPWRKCLVRILSPLHRLGRLWTPKVLLSEDLGEGLRLAGARDRYVAVVIDVHPEFPEPELHVGDVVLLGFFHGIRFRHDGETFALCGVEDILCILELSS